MIATIQSARSISHPYHERWLELRRDAQGELRAGVREQDFIDVAFGVERQAPPVTTMDQALAALRREQPPPAGVLLISDPALPWATVVHDLASVRAVGAFGAVLGRPVGTSAPLPVLSYLSPSDAPRSPDG